MDWFLYDNGLRHERVKDTLWVTLAKMKVFYKYLFHQIESLYIFQVVIECPVLIFVRFEEKISLQD